MLSLGRRTQLKTGAVAKVVCALIVLLLVAAREAQAVDWADARAHDKGCRGTSHIFHVRCEHPDGSWSHDCPDMPNRQFRGSTMTTAPVRLPDRAWTEVAIADATCGPHWGDFKKDNCNGIGKRQYSSILWGIPAGTSWEDTCATMPATVNGQAFSKPSRCVNTGVNMWGEFDIKDPECTSDENTFVGAFKSKPQSEVPFSESCLRAVFKQAETNRPSDGCSAPMVDQISITFKDVFFQACVIHDVCYALPWPANNNGQNTCDNIFIEQMQARCEIGDRITCHSAAQVWRAAMADQRAQQAFTNGQNYQNSNPTAECKGPTTTQTSQTSPAVSSGGTTPPGSSTSSKPSTTTAAANNRPAPPPGAGAGRATPQAPVQPPDSPSSPPQSSAQKRPPRSETALAPAQSPPAACDAEKVTLCKTLLQDRVPWSMRSEPEYRHWQEGNLDNLCRCTPDAAQTVQCFQNELYNTRDSWQEAINICRAR